MKNLQELIYKIGSNTNILVILVIIITLNISWLVTLDSFGKQFEQITGYLPIDLQNTSSILTAPEAVAQINNYPIEAKTFYWSFFILDNLMPPLTFGSLALLWAYYIARHKNRLFDKLKAIPFLLIPFGVGLFDWFENLCFISVIANPAGTNALTIMEIGLIFVRLKAIFILITFGITQLMTVYHISTIIRSLISPKKVLATN